MPELPEVETTLRGVAPYLLGHHIVAVTVRERRLRWPVPESVDALTGVTIETARRRAKYLLFGTSAGTLLIHLGMSGSLSFGQALSPPGAHDHFDCLTDKGLLRLHDPRRFGAVVYAESQNSPVAQKLLGHLGVEPLEDSFTPELFAKALKTRQTAIKPLLLAGDIVVGVGNIYASEALFMAGIRPTTRAARLSKARAFKLHTAIKQVLLAAVAQGGSSLRDFSNAQGQNGYFQLEAKVYDRAGLSCRICSTFIKRLVQGQRSTFYCPVCQKP